MSETQPWKPIASIWPRMLGIFALTTTIAMAAIAETPSSRPWQPNLSKAVPSAEQPTAGEAIEAMYAKAESLLRGSGHDVTISVSGFESLTRDAFASAAWPDLVTLDGPSMQLASRTMHLDDGERRVHVIARWNEPAPANANRLAAAQIDAREAAAILDRPGFHKDIGGDLAGTSVALSSYTVNLQALGESRVYQAAIFWRALEDGTYTSSIQDHVLPIDLIIGIDAEPTPHQDPKSMMGETRMRLPFGAPPTKMADECFYDFESELGVSLIQQRLTGHFVGIHGSRMQAQYDWECEIDCQASCAPSFVFDRCVESPVAVFTNASVTRHKVHHRSDIGAQSSNPMEATCAVAQHCAFGECVGGVCPGISIGVDVTILEAGAAINFQNASESLDEFRPSDTFTRRCRRNLPICATANTVAHTLSIDGAVSTPPTKSGHILDRIEATDIVHHGKQMNYVLEEWALVDMTASPAVGKSVLASSSSHFARSQEQRIATTGGNPLAKGAGSARTMLVIEAPAHANNDRLIPLPKLQVADHRLPPETPTGRAILRLDLADDRSLSNVRVVQDATAGGLTATARNTIAEQLAFEFASEKTHRVIAFVAIEIGEEISMLDSVVFLPKCCGCNPTPPHHCE